MEKIATLKMNAQTGTQRYLAAHLDMENYLFNERMNVH